MGSTALQHPEGVSWLSVLSLYSHISPTKDLSLGQTMMTWLVLRSQCCQAEAVELSGYTEAFKLNVARKPGSALRRMALSDSGTSLNLVSLL